MLKWMFCAAVIACTAQPALAQSHRVYFGINAGVSGGARDPIVDLGGVWTTGGLVGLRLTQAWSVEFEADRGFAASERHSPEAFWISFAPAGSTREDIERAGIRARFDRYYSAGAGLSARIVWRTRDAGRVNAAFYAGISKRDFELRTVRTITHIPEEANLPPGDPQARDADETRTYAGGGYSVGVMVPTRLNASLTLAPDVRFTIGAIAGESIYRDVHASVRLLWGF